MTALYAFQIRCIVHWHDPEDLFQCRGAIQNLLQGVFLNEAHTVRPRSGPNLVDVPASANDGAYGLIHAQQFIDSYTAQVTGMVAPIATNRDSHLARGLG